MNEEQGAVGMIWVLGQFFMIPMAAFAYGFEMFLKTMQEMQTVTNQGLETIVRPPIQTKGPAEQKTLPAPEVAAPAIDNLNSDSGRKDEEEKVLIYNNQNSGLDKNLNDEMLKLVRYKVLFIKRDYEWAFPEQEALVHDNMDASAFTGWKLAEFIQQLQNPVRYGVQPTRVPHEWKGYPGPAYTRRGNDGVLYLTGFPPDDKKYLRVYFEVLERYTREKFRYEEEQIDVLKEIRDCICEDNIRRRHEEGSEYEHEGRVLETTATRGGPPEQPETPKSKK